MNSTKFVRLACAAIALQALIAPLALGDGPLIVDPAARRGYHFGPAEVPVYYDRGDFAVTWDYSTDTPTQVVLGNTVGARLVATGYASWSGVPTTSLRASVKGDFAAKGLPDIDASNIAEIIGKSNGRGIYVVFDADGTIMSDFFGVSPQVLGISSPQYSVEGTTEITESWTVLNGAGVDPADTDAAQFQGVATHEFGHSLGLAHTQANGAAFFYGDASGPASCATLPYTTGVTAADIETMYPYINPAAGSGTGVGQGNVHTLDSMAAISDLYPGRGWPRAYGTIEGKVYDVDGKRELTGVNVIARNLADPYAGATSAVSGQLTQGLLGPDGSFTLHGLKPGGRYVVYVDAIVAGGFPTPPLWFLPGAEKFYRDGEHDGHSHDGVVDPCRYSVVTARAGETVHALITFDHVPGAPWLYQLGYGTGVTGLSGDGSVAVGDFGRGGPVFRWTAKTGIVPMDVPSTGEITSISHNGIYMSSNLYDPNADASLGAYRWDAVNGWLPVTAAGSCGTDTTVNFAVDDNGGVYGLAYGSCTSYRAFRWTPTGGTRLFPSPGVKPDGTPANTRVNKVSADGSTVVGWMEDPIIGMWEGTVWTPAGVDLVRTATGELVDEVTAVSGDGSLVGGALIVGQEPFGDGWRRKARGTKLEFIEPLPGDAAPAQPAAMSRNGDVMVGFSGNAFLSFNPGPFIWTRELGTANFDDFVRGQGTSMEQWWSLWEPTAMSDDGRTIGGWGVGSLYYAGWVLRIDHAFVCHRHLGQSGQPSRHDAETQSVEFPKEFDRHLAHGDVVGRCR